MATHPGIAHDVTERADALNMDALIWPLVIAGHGRVEGGWNWEFTYRNEQRPSVRSGRVYSKSLASASSIANKAMRAALAELEAVSA